MTHEFVEFIPNILKEGIIYVSITYSTVAHKCCCGCGNEVITPLSPTDWKLTFDGESISLYPSIGNWSFDCKSHYWIRNNKIEWAYRWTEEKIKAGRHQDKLNKEIYYQTNETVIENETKLTDDEPKSSSTKTKSKFWTWLKNWFS